MASSDLARTVWPAWPGSAALALAVASGCSLTSLDGLHDGPSGAQTGGGSSVASSSTGDATTMTSAAASGGGGASPASSASASSGGGGGGGEGGAGGAPSATSAGGGGLAEPSPLVGRGLLVRYHLDEAVSGTAPRIVHDAAPDPLDLLVDYGDNLLWDENQGNLGLRWLVAGQEGAALAPIDGTKVEAIGGAHEGTLEVVFDCERALGFGSRLLHVGIGNNSSFSLAIATGETDGTVALATRLQLRLYMGGQPYFAQYDADYHALGRVVVHAVLDTTQEEPEERVRMVLDGERLTRVTGLPEPAIPPQGAALDVLGGSNLVLGNREDGVRAPEGRLFYGAMYEAALTDEEIATNVAELLVTDDDL